MAPPNNRTASCPSNSRGNIYVCMYIYIYIYREREREREREYMAHVCTGVIPGGSVFTIFLPGKPHGQRSLEGYSPWGGKSQTQLSD